MFVMEEENIPEIDSYSPSLLVNIDVDENDVDERVKDLEPAIVEGGLLPASRDHFGLRLNVIRVHLMTIVVVNKTKL